MRPSLLELSIVDYHELMDRIVHMNHHNMDHDIMDWVEKLMMMVSAYCHQYEHSYMRQGLRLRPLLTASVDRSMDRHRFYPMLLVVALN